MDIVVAWAGAAPQTVRADWWTPHQPTPLGCPVLAVPMAALAARHRRADGGGVSVETANRAMRAVVDAFGVVAVSESLRSDGRDYMRERAAIDVRTACFPQGRPHGETGGHAVGVVPVALLPLLLARFATAWQPAGLPGAVAALATDLAARLPQTPWPDAYRRMHRVLSFVACMHAPIDAQSDGAPLPTAPLFCRLGRLDAPALQSVVVGMIMQHQYTADVVCDSIDADARPLLDALTSSPFCVRIVHGANDVACKT